MRRIGCFVVWVTAAVSPVGLVCAEGPGSQPAPELAPSQVGRWGLWECALRARGSYANPFADLRVTATLVSPAGKRLEREGFFDGQDVWRVRVAPDAVGTWQWAVRSSPEDAGLTASGTFACVQSTLPGPLVVHPPNPLWFAFADGTPMYLLAFHLWRAEQFDQATLAKTLDFLQARGFNAVVGPHLERDRMVWAHTPEGKPDFARLDLAVWQNLDRLLRMTGERRMVVIPFSIFGGTNRLPTPKDKAARDMLLRYWVARWGGFWNATYQPVSEWEEDYREEEVLGLGRRLRELDGGQHLISLHSNLASSEAVQRAEWYDYHTVQDKLGERTGQNENKKGNNDPLKFTWLVDLHRKVPKPVLAQECLWEGNFYQGQDGLDVDNLRRGAWVIALCGGQINYADEVVPPRGIRPQDRQGADFFSKLGAAMEPHGLLYPALQHLATFIRALPFQRLTPHPELASTKVCLAEAGHTYAVYAAYGGQVQLDLGPVPGTYHVWWFNPREGQRTEAGKLDGGAQAMLSAPDEQDWVLLVRKAP